MTTSSPLLPQTRETAAWLALLIFAIAVYVFGLGGQYIPSNGDEMVYAHIARMTAATQHWLPLASELIDTRNTKPPLLFWQAMLAGDWGRNWTLPALRAPSVLYTLLIAACVGWSVRLIRRSSADALLAACIYLAFFSSFRYGRAYLTSAPETFWLSLPLFMLLWRCLRSASPSPSSSPSSPPASTASAPESAPGWLAHGLLGLCLGLGLAYKSFALIAPACATWWLALLLCAPVLTLRGALTTTLKVSLSALLALAVFGLWFVLDPDPRAVWQEFVVAENAAKFKDAGGYWREALFGGGSSMGAQLLAYAVNAGLLGLLVLGLAWTGGQQLLRARKERTHVRRWGAHFGSVLGNGLGTRVPPYMAVLLAWALVWLLVFTLPSQRSARYVIPAMPAVAILLALGWRDIAKRWFVPTLLLCALALLLLGRLVGVMHTLGLYDSIELGLALLALGGGLLALLASLLRPASTRYCALLAVFALYASFAATVAPLDGSAGRFAPAAHAALQPGARIAVSNSFNGQFERFQFVLPGGYKFAPYDTEARAQARVTAGSALPTARELLHQLLQSHDAVLWMQSSASEVQAPCLPQCKVLGSRWLFKSRHQSGEVRSDNVWQPQEWLFRREWLVTKGSP